MVQAFIGPALRIGCTQWKNPNFDDCNDFQPVATCSAPLSRYRLTGNVKFF
jgi:hypothetical protein